MSNIIQFKRNLTFEGSYEDAREAVNNLGLSAGEPILVSYVDDSYSVSVVKYFISIGLGDGKVITLPTYDSIDDINTYINDVIDSVLDVYSSSWIDTIDTERSNVSFAKDEETGLIIVTYDGDSGSSTLTDASKLETTINEVTMTQQEFNDMVYNATQWGNIIQ